MRLKVIISVVLIIIMPVIGIFTLNITKTHCDKMIDFIDKMSEGILSGNPDESLIDTAIEYWTEHESYLTSLTSNSLVDDVMRDLCKTKALIELEDYDELLEELYGIKSTILEVRYFDYPNVRRIF